MGQTCNSDVGYLLEIQAWDGKILWKCILGKHCEDGWWIQLAQDFVEFDSLGEDPLDSVTF
jgi:hypothetical protein